MGSVKGRHGYGAALAAVAAVTMLLSGCGSSADQSSGSTTPPGSAGTDAPTATDAPAKNISDMVPDEFKQKGKIVAATEAFYPPFQYAGEDNKTLVGINIELAEALGELLGVKIEMVEAKFDGIIPGIQAGRYDIALDAIGDKPERQTQVDFIDYVKSGSALFVPTANEFNMTGLNESVCGHRIGVVRGTFEVEESEDQAKACEAAGAEKLNVEVFPDQQSMVLAIVSGRVDSILLASAVGSYLATNSGDKFKQVGDLVSAGFQGVVLPKNAEELRDALQAAMQELMDNGKYLEILKKYNMESNATDKATINIAKAS